MIFSKKLNSKSQTRNGTNVYVCIVLDFNYGVQPHMCVCVHMNEWINIEMLQIKGISISHLNVPF